jgi:hypothetical protein
MNLRNSVQWQTFEETSGYVRPERVNKWSNSMTDIWWWWWWWWWRWWWWWWWCVQIRSKDSQVKTLLVLLVVFWLVKFCSLFVYIRNNGDESPKDYWEIVHFVGFYYKIISRSTVLWMSNMNINYNNSTTEQSSEVARLYSSIPDMSGCKTGQRKECPEFRASWYQFSPGMHVALHLDHEVNLPSNFKFIIQLICKRRCSCSYSLRWHTVSLNKP